MYQLLDGRSIAAAIIDDVARHIATEGLEPQLAVILVGDDPASHLYVKLKERACKQAGIIFHKYLIEATASEEEVLTTVHFLNNDPEIDAILIQLPLPSGFNQQRIIDAMDYRKDVDGFHKINIERLLSGKKQHILPGLALGIWRLIETTGSENYTAKNALIISKSPEFSKPLQFILESHGMRVHVLSPISPELAAETRTADILIVTAGKPRCITADMVRSRATVIDVGINKQHRETVGDVDFEHVAPKTAFITPVPGGVGPMTVAMLLYNTWILAKEKY